MLLQVAQLRAENSTLLQKLQEITYMHKDASVDNRILKADVEALRAKVCAHFQIETLFSSSLQIIMGNHLKAN